MTRAATATLEMFPASRWQWSPGDIALLAVDDIDCSVNNRPSIKELLLPLFIQVGSSDFLRADSLGFWRVGIERYWLPRFVFQRTQLVKPRIKIAIFAGLHGDETASILGLIDFVKHLDANPMLGREYQLWIYPVCNPTGYVDGTRHSRSAKDLNREFWKNSLEPEVQLIEQELQHQRFDGIISLHCDDTSHGVYGFVRGATLTRHLLEPALAAAEAALPVNKEDRIDGFHAVNGIIHTAYDGILSAPPDAQPAPFEIILETPHLAPEDLQRQAFSLALESILTTYREMISFAANI
ncbi:MAG TPA: succinylglutamate desuccinylase/aspartoacylase family protein [Chthoniobacteraceae bacterium]|nr:succinylglutamate desuccinylase/aspartoacylase family protein [Chthoniobacteraceae bacterium]